MKKHAAGAQAPGDCRLEPDLAGLALAPLVPFAPPIGSVTPLVAANVLALSLVCSSIAYVLYYRLIADIGPTRALTMAFLMPVFGMLWGALFLRETITLTMIAGCALVVGGATMRAAAGAGPSTPVMMCNARSPRARGQDRIAAPARSSVGHRPVRRCGPRRSPRRSSC